MMSALYPLHLTDYWQLADGTRVTVRPIHPDDKEIEQAFVRNLSFQSRYFRFGYGLQELTPHMLNQFTHIDYDKEMALVAITKENDRDIAIGVGRYVILPDGLTCEFALVIADSWQKRGIGFKLVSNLVDIARSSGLKTMEAEVLAENSRMLSLAKGLGFSIDTCRDDPRMRAITKSL
jgi:acetyltransferase